MLLLIMLGSTIILLAINMLSSNSYHPRDRFYYDEYHQPILRGHMDYQDYAMVHRVKRKTNAMINAVLFTFFVFLGMYLFSSYNIDNSIFGDDWKTEQVEGGEVLVKAR